MEAWEAIQHRQFVDWCNRLLAQRHLEVADLTSGFEDGVALINLLEILVGRPVPRYTKRPVNFLPQKLDNVNVALRFAEAHLGTSTVGLNAQDIVAGRSPKQAMGLVFLLIQKFPDAGSAGGARGALDGAAASSLARREGSARSVQVPPRITAAAANSVSPPRPPPLSPRIQVPPQQTQTVHSRTLGVPGSPSHQKSYTEVSVLRPSRAAQPIPITVAATATATAEVKHPTTPTVEPKLPEPIVTEVPSPSLEKRSVPSVRASSASASSSSLSSSRANRHTPSPIAIESPVVASQQQQPPSPLPVLPQHPQAAKQPTVVVATASSPSVAVVVPVAVVAKHPPQQQQSHAPSPVPTITVTASRPIEVKASVFTAADRPRVVAVDMSDRIAMLARDVAVPSGPPVPVDESSFSRAHRQKSSPSTPNGDDARASPSESPATSSPERDTDRGKDKEREKRREERKKRHHSHKLSKEAGDSPDLMDSGDDISKAKGRSRRASIAGTTDEVTEVIGDDGKVHRRHHHHHRKSGSGSKHSRRHSKDESQSDACDSESDKKKLLVLDLADLQRGVSDSEMRCCSASRSTDKSTSGTMTPPSPRLNATPSSELLSPPLSARSATLTPPTPTPEAVTPRKKQVSGRALMEAAFYGHPGGRQLNLHAAWDETEEERARNEDIRKSVLGVQALWRCKTEGSAFRRSKESLQKATGMSVDCKTLLLMLRFKAVFSARLALWREKRTRIRNEVRRNEVAHEIFRTEKSYVDSLRLINRLFYVPAQGTVPEQTLRHIFSNILIILKYNELLLKRLEDRMKSWGPDCKLGDIFLELSSFLKVYTPYVNNYANSFTAVQELLAENKKFAEYLEQCKLGPECGGLDLNSYLIMPIQRIPRYVMLLQDMVKCTRREHPDFPSLEKALKEIKAVADYVNEKKREAENLNQVLCIQKKIVGKFESLAMPHRRFVRQGLLFESDEKECRSHVVFLFNDSLLLSRPKADHGVTIKWKRGSVRPLALQALEEVLAENERYKFEAFITLRGAGIFDVPDDDLKGIKFAFQLRLAHSKALTLNCLTAEEKSSWIADIDECISAMLEKDYVRFSVVVEQRKKRGDGATASNNDAPAKKQAIDVVAPDYEGAVLVQGVRGWKSRWIVLKAGNLYIFRSAKAAVLKEPRPLKVLPVLTARVSRVSDKPNAFFVVAPDRLYLMAAQEAQEMFRWLFFIREAGMARLAREDDLKMALIHQTQQDHFAAATTSPTGSPAMARRDSVAPGGVPSGLAGTVGSALTGASPAPAPTTLPEQDAEAQSVLELLKSQPANKVCADCSRAHVGWVSLSFGVFICNDCSVLHRQLPAGVSETMSIRALMKCPLSRLENLRKAGNARANAALEADMPAGLQKPGPEDPRAAKLAWVQAKYSQRQVNLDGIVAEEERRERERSGILMPDFSATVRCGELRKREGALVQSAWRRYEFVLTRTNLFYRKKNDDAHTPRPSNWKALELTLCTPKEPDRIPADAPYAFELVMPARIFTLVSETLKDKQSWMDAITSVKSQKM